MKNPQRTTDYALQEADLLKKYAEEQLQEGDSQEALKAISLAIQLIDFVLRRKAGVSRNDKLELIRKNLGILRLYFMLSSSPVVEVKKEISSEPPTMLKFPAAFLDQEAKEAFEKYKHTIVMPRSDNTWDKVIGQEQAKRYIYESITNTLLFENQKTEYDYATGILMYGPPGTGKSMIARAVASKISQPFIEIQGSQLISKWQGESERNIRAFFIFARLMNPCVVFIDEIDSLLGRRSTSEETPESRRGISTQLLVDLQGNPGLFVIGATNTPWQIDPAFLRRFDRKCYISLPNLEERKILLSQVINVFPNTVLKKDIDVFAQVLRGYSPSDIISFVKGAAARRYSKARQSRYFAKGQDNKWFVASANYPNFQVTSCEEIVKKKEELLLPPLSAIDLELAVRSKTTRPEELVLYEEFKKTID